MSGQRGNILLVANFASDVGYAWWLMETFWVEIAQHFHSFGHQTFLIYPRITKIPASVSESPIIVIEHDIADKSSRACRGLRDIIRSKKITSVYLTDRPYLDFFYVRLRLWGVKKIVLHDHAPGERPPITLFKGLMKQIVHALRVFSCDHYIGVSKFVYDRFIRTGMIPRKKCSCIVNGIKPIMIRPEWRNYTHQYFGFPKTATIIVTTGRASLYKGIDFMIRCAEHLVHERGHKNLYFLHCGDGPDKQLFARMIAELGLQEHFILAGNRNDVPAILQSCQIAFHASHGEAFSLSILEYMSAGLPTLAPNMCGNGEAIENGRTGFLYQPGNMQEVTEIIESLVRDEARRQSIGEAASRRVADFFAIGRMREEFVRLISTTL